jgi:hypothetical protein
VCLVALLLASRAPIGAAVRFVERAQSWGVDFVHHHGGSGDLFMIETMGSGLALLDYDGDGDDDLLMIDSGPVRGEERGTGNGSRLFRQDGTAGEVRFLDVTPRSGLAPHTYGMGVAAADVDGDGDIDLYLTGFGPNELWLNRGDGSYGAAPGAGVEDPRWSMSAGFADSDLDGDLDLYVTNYVDFAFDNNPICGLESRQLRSYCHPDVYDGLPDSFYRGRGDGTFEDATAAAGFSDARGKGLGVLFQDLDDDRAPDVYVANDMTANNLFRNLGDGTFADIAVIAGVAFSDRGEPEASMGVDSGDLDGDGRPEIMLTHLDQQSNAVYSAGMMESFADQRYMRGLAEPSFYRVGFGLAFADLDNDGRLDIVVANGHIVHNIDLWDRGTTYKQANQVFHNTGGTFVEASDAGLDVVRASRGLAVGDLDRDGDLDLVINNSNDAAEAYENRGADGEWVIVDLPASPGGSTTIGCEVLIERDGVTQRRIVRTASSYLSQNASGAHFGVGPGGGLLQLTIRRPRGGARRWLSVPPNRRLRIAP